jgi:hypothetical protein
VSAAAAEHVLPIGPEVFRDVIHFGVVIGLDAEGCSFRYIGLTRGLAIRAMKRTLVDFAAHALNMAVPILKTSQHKCFNQTDEHWSVVVGKIKPAAKPPRAIQD